MTALEVADLVLIASRTLGLDTGQVLDLLDAAAAEHALAQARPGSGPADPATCAAVLLHALVRQRPLRHGNQQVALAAMLQFLALNGWDMDPDPPGPVAAMVTRIAAGTLDIKDVAGWLAPPAAARWPCRGPDEGGTDARPPGAAAGGEDQAGHDADPAQEHVHAVHRPGQAGRHPGAG